MKTRIILYIFISLFLGLLTYLFTTKIIFLIIYFILFLSSFLFFEFKFFKQILLDVKKLNDMRNFLKVFILTLSFEKSIENLSNDFQEECKLINEYNLEEKIEKLDQYFQSYFFTLFVKAYKSNNEKIMSLINKCNEIKIAQNYKIKKTIKKNVFCFIFLYFSSILILFILRLALENYFNKLVSSSFYLISIALYFLFILISCFLLMVQIKKGLKCYD